MKYPTKTLQRDEETSVANYDYLINARRKFLEDKAKAFVFLDVESTGRDPFLHEILTIGAVITDLKGKVFSEYHIKSRPENLFVWDREAEEKIHGISIEEAMHFPTKSQAFAEFIEWLKANLSFFPPSFFVCHAKNTGMGLFDWVLLYNEMTRYGLHHKLLNYVSPFLVRSTVNFAAEAKKNGFIEPENLKLKTLTNLFKISNEDHHNALNDAIACKDLYFELEAL